MLWTPDHYCYVFLLLNCNSDSIRLDIRWHETNGIYMRVSLFGLFLRCTSLMWPWPKRIQSLLHYCFRYMNQILFLSWYLLGYDSSDDSCLSSYYDSYYRPLIIIVTYSSVDFHMICISDSIRLDTLWHETKGIYMRVSLFGLFLRCTNLMWP